MKELFKQLKRKWQAQTDANKIDIMGFTLIVVIVVALSIYAKVCLQ